MTDIQAAAGDLCSARGISARLERIPVARWHVRVRLILGTATFFDAFDLLAMSFALPQIAGQWHLDGGQIGLILSAAFVGQLVGAIAWGWAAEKWGRLFVANLTIALFGLMSLACVFAWDQHSLMIFRFLQGVGLGGEVPIATTYINEISRAQGRGRFYILYELIFSFGLLAAAVLGYFMVPNLGWQSMFLLGAAPALLALILRRVLPESPRWLASRGRLAEADAVVAQIERSVAAEGRVLPPPVLTGVVPPLREKSRPLEIFEGVYLQRTLCVWALWFCCFSTTYGLVSWLPSLYSTVFHLPLSQSLGYGLATQATGIIGSGLCAILIDKTGRRAWFTVAFLAGGGALLALAAIGPSTAMLLLVFVSLSSFFMSSVAIGLNLYTAELYPTRIRAFGNAVGGAWQRVAAALGPLVVGYLVMGGGLGAVFTYFGVIAVIGGIVTVLFATETTGKSLEELSP